MNRRLLCMLLAVGWFTALLVASPTVAQEDASPESADQQIMALIIDASELASDGRTAEAAATYRRALVLAQTLPESDSTAEILRTRLTDFMGVKEAEVTLLEALAGTGDARDESGDARFRTRMSLASLYDDTGETDPALRIIEEGLQEDAARAGGRSQQYREMAGRIARRAGRLELAETYQREVLALAQQEVFSVRTQVDAGSALKDLAQTLWAAGRHAEAESLFQEALAANARDWGEGSLQVAQSLQNLAVVKTFNGEVEDALAYRRRSLNLLLDLRCPNHRERSSWRIERVTRPELRRSESGEDCHTAFPLIDFVTNLAHTEWRTADRPAAATRLYVHGSDLVLGRNLIRYSSSDAARAEYQAGQIHHRRLIAAAWDAGVAKTAESSDP